MLLDIVPDFTPPATPPCSMDTAEARHILQAMRATAVQAAAHHRVLRLPAATIYAAVVVPRVLAQTVFHRK